jgi:riboflavin transporter FmnP
MDTKTLAVIIVFAALTIALNPAVSGIGVPAPYLPFLVYQIWEVPIVVLFLLAGPKYAIPIAVLNAFVLLALFIGPGGLPAGPFYNLIANLSTLLGIFIIEKIYSLRFNNRRKETSYTSGSIRVAAATAMAIVLRVLVMTVVNYVTLGYSYPIGFSTPEAGIIALLPLIGLFNATLALYTVPLGYFINNIVERTLGFNIRSRKGIE